MLDKFLEVSFGKTKQAESKARMVALMMKLPNEELKKIASGEIKLSYGHEVACVKGEQQTWLQRFKGTPLFDQAVSLEQHELELDMQSDQQRARDDVFYRETDSARNELCIQKKLLELELVKSQDASSGMTESGSPEAAALPMVPPVKVDVKGPTPPVPPVEEPKMAAVKTAIAVSTEGHEYDAAINRIKEEAALNMLALGQKHKGIGGWTEKGLERGDFGKTLRGFTTGFGEEDPRVYAHRAALHEAGKNPLNPFGGSFTPHPAEGKGAKWWNIGKIDLSKAKKSPDKTASAPMSKEAMLMKAAYLSECDDWLDKFKGTPLFDQAVQIEEQMLQQEMEEIQNRDMNREQRESIYAQRDQLRVQKRSLTLQLLTGATGGMEEPEPEMEMAPEEGMGAEQAVQQVEGQKAASIRFKRAMLKMAKVEMEKDAIGAAMLAGLKGAGQFMGGAGKAVGRAFTGAGGGMPGVRSALQMAGQKSMTGARKVGRFAAAQPGAAAALGAGALGAAGLTGAAAGRLSA